MNPKKVIFYKDELNDEFSDAKIIPRTIDKNYIFMSEHSTIFCD